jgi:thioesterase domain-containing protein/NAD(P)-dependent dehydrogenase (short-subunit alcohol dehydrogenase family)/acyl carrier protein
MLQTRHTGKVVLSLDDEAREVIRVRAGRQFQQLGAAEFVIRPSHEDDYRKLFDALGPAAERIDGIAHLWNITRNVTPAGSDKDPLEKHLERGFFSLTGLAKAIGGRELSQPIDLCLVSNRMHDVAGETDIEPAKAALLGPCRVIPREFGNIRCRSIDIDSSGSAWRREMLLEQLASELDSASGDSTVAFRGADRWVQNYEPAPLAPQAASAGLRPTGVYLITGAFGGIGLELARHLAETVQARLVLVGRNEPTADNLEAMRQCAALGAEVLAVKADVADDRQMRRAVKQAQARFGAIHGVFHAAGVLDDGLIQMKEPSAAMRVLAPKVKGSLALDAALRGVQLDFLVLFSSVSSALGLEGQCDYTAANAFLDAFALRKSKRDGIRTQAINWGAWKEVGLAVRASKSQRKDAKTITTKFDCASHWLLAEHAIRGSGAILPGTGYLELARAAFQEGSSAPGGVEIGNVVFQSPFLVPAGESKALSITLTRSASGTEFVFHSSSPEQTHATGTIGHAEALPPAHIDLTAVRHRCDGREEIFDGFLRQNFMDFGPRWGNVRSVRYGSGEALIAMVLPEKFGSDLESSPLHPALLDMATGGAQQLIPGFQQDKTFFVPFSYGRLLLRRALPAKLFSHVRLKEGSGPGMATFDVTLADENGSVVAEIADFVIRPAGDLTRVAAADHAGSVVEEGMLNREGFDALARILGSPVGPQIVVSPLDLELWLKQTDAAVKRVLEHSTASGKSLIGGAGGQLEHRLAEMWSGILGVKEIGPRDDFFQLGGHSLLLVRLAARIEREFKKTIPLSFLFESATIEKIAAFLREGAPEDSGFLAPFREEGQGPAFFCVHSVGGDVAGFRNLARLLDPGQKFYGVQLPPELRNPDFPVSVEAMASRYVEEVMAVQAEGPYILGGWSAGAPVALEMAQQLERKGQRVELLVSFDGAPFNTGGETSRWNPLYYGKLLHNVPYWVRDNLYVNFSRSYLSQRISGKLRGLAKKFGARLRGKADFAKYEVRGFLAGLEFSPQALAFMESFYNAVQRYVPHRYAGRVLLYQGRTEPLYHLLEVDRAWNQIAQNLEVVRVKGTHGSLLDDGRVQPIAEHLNQRLRECRNQAATQSCCSMRTVTPISTARSFSS